MISWSKSESRQVRPFFSLDSYEECLGLSEIKLFEGQSFSSAEAYVLQNEELGKVNPELRLNMQLPKIDDPILKRMDLSLLVCISGPVLKKTLTLACLPLSESIPDILEIPPSKIQEVGGAENLSIKLGICLNKDLPPAIGRPFLAGHWIAKKVFRIRLAKEANQFDVLPRDDAGWRQHGYPDKTLFAVEYASGMNDPVEKDSPIGSVWVHSDVFNRLAVDSDSKKARAISSMLTSEIALQFIVQSSTDWLDADMPTPNSPLFALHKQLFLAEKIEFSKLKQLVQQPGQAKLRAILQNQQLVVRSLVEF